MNANEARELSKQGGANTVSDYLKKVIYSRIKACAEKGDREAFFYPEGGFNAATAKMLEIDGYTVTSSSERNETTYRVTW